MEIKNNIACTNISGIEAGECLFHSEHGACIKTDKKRTYVSLEDGIIREDNDQCIRIPAKVVLAENTVKDCYNCTLSMSEEQWQTHKNDGTYECPSCGATF